MTGVLIGAVCGSKNTGIFLIHTSKTIGVCAYVGGCM